MFDIAPEFNAVIIFAEHRYYGESLPFGKNSFKSANIGFLSIEQALADYAAILLALKPVYDNAHVITFGGSYGGMLSGWMRMKYPFVVDMALAASAPYKVASLQVEPTAVFQASIHSLFCVITRHTCSPTDRASRRPLLRPMPSVRR